MRNGRASETLEWLALLDGDNADRGWVIFLRAFARIIIQVIAVCESDTENRAECFVYVCEQLAQHRFRRLRRFKREGPASFATWLRAVVRNLCVDWRRHEFGRTASLRARPAPLMTDPQGDQLIRCEGNENGTTSSESRSEGDQVCAKATARQTWGSRLVTESLEGEDGLTRQLADPAPTPETMAETLESKRALRRGLAALSFQQRLAIRLRFEQDLTLQEIAAVLQLKNAQAADRVLRNALARLREALEPSPPFGGKTKPASV